MKILRKCLHAFPITLTLVAGGGL